MKLYLVRHGEADSKEVNPERPLTPQGRADVEVVAKAAADRITALGAIWHSPKLRARQTAEILAGHIPADAALVERDDLVDGPVGQVARDVESAAGDLMIVSHIPFLPKLAGKLIEGDEDAQPLAFPAGGLACLEADDAMNWTLAWTMGPGEVT